MPFAFLVARKNQALSFSKATGCLVAVVQAMVAYSSAEGIGRTDFHHEGHEEHKVASMFCWTSCPLRSLWLAKPASRLFDNSRFFPLLVFHPWAHVRLLKALAGQMFTTENTKLLVSFVSLRALRALCGEKKIRP